MKKISKNVEQNKNMEGGMTYHGRGNRDNCNCKSRRSIKRV
jgi:hypothetical protein